MATLAEMPSTRAGPREVTAGHDAQDKTGTTTTEGKASPSGSEDPASAVTGRSVGVGGEAEAEAEKGHGALAGDQDDATRDGNLPTETAQEEGANVLITHTADAARGEQLLDAACELEETEKDEKNSDDFDGDGDDDDENSDDPGDDEALAGLHNMALAHQNQHPQEGGGRRRSVRQSAHITQEELSSCFHLPSEAACRALGIGLTVLKRQCRKYGIKRWPFRKMKSLDRLITNVQAGISPGDQNRVLVKSVEELEVQKQRMQECHDLDLDENTKRLQQAYSKANHKARRAAHAGDMGGVGGLLALSGGEPPPHGGHGGGVSNARLAMAQAAAIGDGRPHDLNRVLAQAKAQAELLRGVASTIPALLPGQRTTSQQISEIAARAVTAGAQGVVDAATIASLTARGAASNPFAPPGGGGAPGLKGTSDDGYDGYDARNPTDAVVGAWSPARPVVGVAKKEAGTDRGACTLEQLLAGGLLNAGVRDGWDDREESARGRKRKPSAKLLEYDFGGKRGGVRGSGFGGQGGQGGQGGGGDDDDADPLASLAAAALAVKEKVPGRGRGRPPGSKNLPKHTHSAPHVHDSIQNARDAALARFAGAASSGGEYFPITTFRRLIAHTGLTFIFLQSGFGTAAHAHANTSGFSKSAVTLLVTEHADRIREALLKTVLESEAMTADTKETQVKKINEVVGVESLKLRDALNNALAFLNV